MVSKASRSKSILVYILTLFLGYFFFIFPNLFFGITGWNGGLSGINLAFIAVFQFLTVTLLLFYSLRRMGTGFRYIGLTASKVGSDALLGIGVALLWTMVQFTWLIPFTGGEDRADIRQMVDMMNGTESAVVYYILLGILGGGITEELFNRGFTINVLKGFFRSKRKGLIIASVFSIILFAAGHLPQNGIEWLDILVPTIAYTVLFVSTGRLTASMVAHSLYNLLAILLTYYLYTA